MIRTVIAILFASLLTACAQSRDQLAPFEARLEALLTGEDEMLRPVPGAAVAVWRDGEIIWSHAVGAAVFGEDGMTVQRPLTPQSSLRVASISKLVTALTALRLAEDGLVELDADVSGVLGFDLPVQPGGAPVTLGALLSHTSGICDPAVYWAAAGDTLQALLTGDATCPYPPGEGWRYANINYGLAAQVMEIAAQERFDRLAASHVLTPMGLDAGFNWSGVSRVTRQNGATLHRWSNGAWVPQVDDRDTLSETRPAILRRDGEDVAVDAPQSFDNGTLFSPQGGLRASVEDLAILVSAFLPGGMGDALGEPVWTGEEAMGVRAYGRGPRVLLPGQIASHPDLRFVGHAGEAYGLYGGAWALPDRGATVAFFVTGVDPESDLSRDPVSGFTRYEAVLMSIALDALDRFSSTGEM
ncbi:serine hydrolase domain-containing protein [Hyphobacterium sp.]|uniref:serine hydrolase domain-containing protein n=1 Tax=Hyphobacterium sp. TaxID=2004662 RepID=UPI003BABD8C4